MRAGSKDAVRDELRLREPIFHRPELGTSRSDFEAMMVPGFWEVGASGRVYSRDFVLDTLEQRHIQPHEDLWEVQGFDCTEIAADNYLATYSLIQGPRITRRATLWWRTTEGWKAVYHQGTVVADA